MKKIFIFILKIYSKTISKIISSLGYHCKFYPTCSEYTRQAIEKYGVLKGCILGAWRVLRCNPFSKGGYDPLR